MLGRPSGGPARREVPFGLPTLIHLATAALAAADRFITNNRKDFPKTIGEVDIVYPEDLRIRLTPIEKTELSAEQPHLGLIAGI